ncbi:hypothetical protein AC477_02055 [miscellaneous Crenarchaeota group-1 archaeon SG8-32-1]|uniref:DUF5667 domain-containing protein n=1 Tax=miscellaneous Crenarchaeota group-1 archaeon SG8-32-1 TaxID=1685124 RepID=A0A0M0BY54_9ARCH|nr:MAG: hypothetical protein AC477_02055 [miscellaneous Crenarchaeota group-1 archaeon SG8-32-1]
MNKQTRIASVVSLVLLLVSVGSVSAVLTGQSPENRANRMVEIAENAADRVGDLIERVEADLDASELIGTDEFLGNVTLYGEGVENVTNANTALGVDDFEGAIANATEALNIFREVYLSIQFMLYDYDIKIGPLVDVDELEEAIVRSLERVEDLEELISSQAPIYEKLMYARGNLTEALGFLPDNVEDAKSSYREANMLLGEISQHLKQVAQELNPQRIRDYCETAYQYRERFREQFRGGREEGFDVNGFLQTQGYQDEDDFMARFQEMIENAKGSEDIEDLEDIGRTIREMDQNLNEELGGYRARYGQKSTDSGNGQMGSGYGGSSGSGQPGFGGGQ